MIASRFSLHAFGLPGRVMMIVLFLMPVTGRDKAANEVIEIDEDSKRCVMPGVLRVNNGSIAYVNINMHNHHFSLGKKLLQVFYLFSRNQCLLSIR
jgi:hypothetical protein